MTSAKRVVYVGPEPVFHGLEGRLIEAEDRDTHRRCLYFQPESDGIMAVACEPEHVRAVETTA
jgi:hypothetical protein